MQVVHVKTGLALGNTFNTYWYMSKFLFGQALVRKQTMSTTNN